MVALFMTAIAISNVIGSPISGAIMQYMDGVQRLARMAVAVPAGGHSLGPHRYPGVRAAAERAEEGELADQPGAGFRGAADPRGRGGQEGPRAAAQLHRCLQGRPRMGAGRGLFLRRGVLLRGQLLDAHHHSGAGHRQEGFPQGRAAEHDSVGLRRRGHGGMGEPLGPHRRAALACGRRAAGRDTWACWCWRWSDTTRSRPSSRSRW